MVKKHNCAFKFSCETLAGDDMVTLRQKDIDHNAIQHLVKVGDIVCVKHFKETSLMRNYVKKHGHLKDGASLTKKFKHLKPNKEFQKK